jgi:predicted transcriptional regulator of viral defense system
MSTQRHTTQAAHRQRLLTLLARRRTITRQDVIDTGVHTQVLTRLVRAGELERIARGRYRHPEAPITEHHGLALVAAAAPKAVICLVSALSFHGIGTQLPWQVWIAIDRRARAPTLSYPPLRVFRFSGNALSEGITEQQIEGETVHVYSVAKTLADLFKYRNKIGLDVCLEALREIWRERRATMEDIDHYARICRVHNVMRPYLEALLA